MLWNVTTSPSSAVLTWTQLKNHVRPGGLKDQEYIMTDLLPSAYDYAETMLECALSPQTITVTYDIEDIGGFRAQEWNYLDQWTGCPRWQVPRGPILSITSITDVNGHAVAYQRHTAGNADYIIPMQPIYFNQCPVTMIYQAGYESIPQSILNAIRVHVATLYMVREDTTNLAANPIHKIEEFYRFKGRGTVVAWPTGSAPMFVAP